MRILFVANYSDLYGANRSMLTIMEYLKDKGYEISLILPEHGKIEDELKQKGMNYVVIRCFTQLYYYKRQFKYLLLPLLVIHAYLQLKIAKKLGIKHISHIREFMDLDYNAKYIFGKRKKKEYINQSDGVIYVSKAVSKHVNLGEPLQQWQKVIYNGVDSVKNSFIPTNIPDEINLGIVGIFDSAKGQDIAIKMMPSILEMYPKVKLHIWGDKEGLYKKKLYRLVRKLRLSENVIFHGFEKNPDVIYGKMNVLMMCSRCEGFGRVTIEAMQRGIPVLGYNAGGTAELVKDGVNGYLFTSAKECVQGLTKIMQSEDEFNKVRMGAYKDAITNYSVSLYCTKVESFIKQVVEETNGNKWL